MGRAGRRSRAEPPPVEVGHHAAGPVQRLGFVAGQVVAQPRDPRVHRGAAQLLFVGVLADRHLHQRRAAQEHPGPSLHEDRVVAHARQVGPTRRRRPEDHADGRDAGRRELGQPAELGAAGDEDVGLAGQVGSAGLDQDHHRQAVGLGHVHGPEQLGDGGRAGRPPSHGGVVGDHQALGARHLDQGDHQPAPQRVVGLHPGQRRELEHRGARVDQCLEALSGEQLVSGPVPLDVALATASEDPVAQGPDLGRHLGHGRPVRLELLAPGIEVAGQRGAHRHAGERRLGRRRRAHRSVTHEG